MDKQWAMDGITEGEMEGKAAEMGGEQRRHYSVLETVNRVCTIWACAYILILTGRAIVPFSDSMSHTATFIATSESEWVGGGEEMLLQSKEFVDFFCLISVLTADQNGKVNLFTIQVERLWFCKNQISYSS